MTNICILGSSIMWTPGLVTDLMCVFPDPLEIRLIDIRPQPLKLCAEWCEAARRHHRRRDRVRAFMDRRRALKGTDAVLITLSTGGLDAMEHDVRIPEKYGIYTTVGDTAGPSGWSRSLRNIPVFRAFADDFRKYCPTAFIANYTNPMASLTATLQQCCGNPSVGLCHAYFETKDVIQKIFKLKDWSAISIEIAGMNHFTWVTDFRIGRKDGYQLLRRKIGAGSLRDVLPAESADEIGFYSGHKLCAELFDAFGYLPYPGDRHTAEFLSFVIAGCPGHPRRRVKRLKADFYTRKEIFDYCGVKRTSVAYRRASVPQGWQRVRRLIRGREPMPGKSRETGAEMIHAYLHNRPFTDAVNHLNIGQIAGLPAGACVETLGVVDGMGVRPLMVKHVPEHLLEIMRPQAVCQKWVVAGVLQGKSDLLLQALYRDPQCAHLKPHEIRRMADELLRANREYGKVL